MIKNIFNFFLENFELLFWMAALIYLFWLSPAEAHFTLCPLKNAGFDHCPGCGLGHSIHDALWLDFKASFIDHPFGLLAIIIIIQRIITLIKISFTKSTNYGNKSFAPHSRY